MGNEGMARRRHPEEGGYARGEETRARIIAAALRIFGEHGYDQASTRQIAASAGVNPPALQYYFGGKEGLHRACAQYIIDRVSQVLDPALERAAAVRGGDRPFAVEALCGLLDAMVDALVVAGSESWSRFIARGKVDGAGPAMGMLHEHVGLRLRDAATRLVAQAIGCPAREEATRLRAGIILGQVTCMYANREYSLAAMGWAEYDARKLALIKAVVRENTRAALGGSPPQAAQLAAVPRAKARTTR